MTAPQLFRRHVLNALRRYDGGMADFCQAVAQGHLPDAQEPEVAGWTARLREHLGSRWMPPGDEQLLSYALLAPGRQRGLQLPLLVLRPERGGFSQPRREEAAASAIRLRQPLEMARRHLGLPAAETSEQFQAVLEMLAKAKPPAPECWIEWHASLPEAEAQWLAQEALNGLAGSEGEEDPDEFRFEILACLAKFRTDGLGEALRGCLERGIFYPPELYRGASPAEAQALVERIETSAEFNGHQFLALAWTRGEVALGAFVRWAEQPPGGGHGFSAAAYAREAGWEWSADGRPRWLSSEECWLLSEAPADLPSSALVPCREHAGQDCAACSGPLVWLFDFRAVADRFPSDFQAAPLRVLCCLHCALWEPFFTCYEAGGKSTVHPANVGAEPSGEPCEHLPARRALLHRVPPWVMAGFSLEDASTLGGLPRWWQSAAYPTCPDCDAVMPFLAQFDNSTLPVAEEGTYYAFYCGACSVAAVNYQQT